jgi:hypothetical protein
MCQSLFAKTTQLAITDSASPYVLAWWLSNTMPSFFSRLEEAIAHYGRLVIFNTD